MCYNIKNRSFGARMKHFIYIAINIVLPIFLLTGIGFLIQKIFRLDLKSINKLNIYVFVPAILFVKIYETEISWNMLLTALGYITVIMLAMYVLAFAASKALRLDKSKRMVFLNAMIFFNSGNYGIPLISLAFPGNPVALTGQIMIMLIQNITNNTIGVFQASHGRGDIRKAFRNMLIMPSMYVFIIAGIVKLADVRIPDPIMIPLNNIADGFIAMALISLGIQLADIKFRFELPPIAAASIIRLVIAPLIGAAILKIAGADGVLAKSLILGVATPVAVTTAIIAKEFDNSPEFAAEIVFSTTLLSALTVSAVIFFLDFL